MKNNLTKHFQQLEDYEFMSTPKQQETTFAEILELEKMIFEGEIKHFGNQLRKLLEELLFDIFEYTGMLGEQVRQLTQEFQCPTNVWSSLNFLKSISNRESHAGVLSKSDNKFQTILTPAEAVVSLKCLFILIKFVLYKKNPQIDVEEMKFDDAVYTIGEKISEQIDKKLENPNNDLEPYLFSIAQLIMLKDYKFNIPTYQRDYRWKKDQTLKLLDDIKMRSEDNKTHYFGAIAVASDDQNKILRIIDGQQRITTSLIILKAFYDEFTKMSYSVPEELAELVQNKMSDIYMNQKVIESQKQVWNLMNDKHVATIKSSNKSAAYVNYHLTRDFLKPLNEEKLNEFYATFVQYFNAGVLVFKTTIDNEMDIYENLNTGGIKLSGWELIKNYIFSRLEPTVFMEYEKDINTYINKNLDSQAYEMTPNGDSNKVLDPFFMIFSRLEYATKKNEVLESRENREAFKGIWPKMRNEKFQEYENYLEEVNEVIIHFNLYKELKMGYKNNESKIHSFSHILDLIVKDDTMPTLMYWLKECSTINENFKISKINKKKFWKLLRAIECYFVRVDTFGNSQSKIWDKFLMNYKNSKELGEEFFKYAQTSNMNPTMQPIEAYISNYSQNGEVNQMIIKNICINAERLLRKITASSGSFVAFEKTHEHILAQNLSFKDYGQEISEQEFNEKLSMWKNSIGNALILTRDLNSSAGNKPFIKKIPVYEKSNSQLAKGNLPEIMNLLNKDIFTFDDIKERAKQMAKFTSKIYSEIGEY